MKSFKKSKKNNLLLIIVGIIFTTLLPISGNSTNDTISQTNVIWSDDFNDGELDGWKISGAYFPLDGPISLPAGQAEIINGEMWFTGEQLFRRGTLAIHESNVSYGSWSVDIKISTKDQSSNHTHFYFMDNRAVDELPNFNNLCCYDLLIYAEPWQVVEPPGWMKVEDDKAPAFILIRRSGLTSTFKIIDYYQTDKISGWQHIDITRDETGTFKVYINNTLRIEGIDNTHKESKSAYLTSETGIAYDNVSVRNDVIVPKSTVNSTPVFNNLFTSMAIAVLIARRCIRKKTN